MPEFKHPFRILDTRPNPVFRLFGTSSEYVSTEIKKHIEKEYISRNIKVYRFEFDPDTNTGTFCYEYPSRITSMYELQMLLHTLDYSYKVSFTGE